MKDVIWILVVVAVILGTLEYSEAAHGDKCTTSLGCGIGGKCVKSGTFTNDGVCIGGY